MRCRLTTCATGLGLLGLFDPDHNPTHEPAGFGLRHSAGTLLNRFCPKAPDDWRSPKRWRAELANPVQSERRAARLARFINSRAHDHHC
jgi:hypothetical protein